jgi:hypothetical protein
MTMSYRRKPRENRLEFSRCDNLPVLKRLAPLNVQYHFPQEEHDRDDCSDLHVYEHNDESFR